EPVHAVGMLAYQFVPTGHGGRVPGRVEHGRTGVLDLRLVHRHALIRIPAFVDDDSNLLPGRPDRPRRPFGTTGPRVRVFPRPTPPPRSTVPPARPLPPPTPPRARVPAPRRPDPTRRGEAWGPIRPPMTVAYARVAALGGT